MWSLSSFFISVSHKTQSVYNNICKYLFHCHLHCWYVLRQFLKLIFQQDVCLNLKKKNTLYAYVSFCLCETHYILCMYSCHWMRHFSSHIGSECVCVLAMYFSWLCLSLFLQWGGVTCALNEKLLLIFCKFKCRFSFQVRWSLK